MKFFRHASTVGLGMLAFQAACSQNGLATTESSMQIHNKIKASNYCLAHFNGGISAGTINKPNIFVSSFLQSAPLTTTVPIDSFETQIGTATRALQKAGFKTPVGQVSQDAYTSTIQWKAPSDPFDVTSTRFDWSWVAQSPADPTFGGLQSAKYSYFTLQYCVGDVENVNILDTKVNKEDKTAEVTFTTTWKTPDDVRSFLSNLPDDSPFRSIEPNFKPGNEWTAHFRRLDATGWRIESLDPPSNFEGTST